MATLEERIAQYKNMAEADPENEMAHFSLGSAYLKAGRAAEAAASLERCVELNPEMSKAWQLCGEALINAGWSDKAVVILQRGYEVAASKGDLLPRDAMADLLRGIGREPPELAHEATATASTGEAGRILLLPPDRTFRQPTGGGRLSRGRWGNGLRRILPLRPGRIG